MRTTEARVRDRTVAELLGICQGLICDGKVVDGEILGLARWIAGNPTAATCYPGDVLSARLQQIFDDGVITEQERADLTELLAAVTGETVATERVPAQHFLTHPLPAVVFADREYAFTGKMCYGTRQAIERVVVERGGRVHGDPRRETNYLVLGTLASSNWSQSAFGQRLLRAKQLRDAGADLNIISEEWFIRCALHG